MRNRITRYELVLTNGQQTYLLAYTPRLSRLGILSAARSRSTDVLRLTNLSESAIATWPNTRTLDLGENGWQIRFSGRTQIDAQDSREWPFIGTIQSTERITA